MTSSRRTFLAGITIGAVASAFTHRVGGQETVIDSSMVIDEPGVYELADDLDGEAREYDVPGVDVCLWIRASDVTIEGNGYTISGDGTGIGVQVAGPESFGEAVENVTIRDLQTENWGTGIGLGHDREWTTSARLDNVEATDNSRSGVYLFAADGSELRNVTASENGGSGIYLWEVGRVTANGITASENGLYGLRFHDIVFDSEFTDVTITGNGRAGIDTGIDVLGNTFRDLTVTENDGPGIISMDGGSNTIEDALIENNAGEGILLRDDSETLVDVTIRDNDGLQVDARDGSRLTASGLRIANDTVFAFEREALSLDGIAQIDLPKFPENSRTVGDGVEVENVDSLEARFEYDEVDVDGAEVELWRHDGYEWSPVASFDADEAIDTTLSEDGVYAPVSVVSDDSDSGMIVSDLDFASSTVVRGETFDVTVTVENATSETRTETIGLRIGDAVETRTEIELAAGDIGTVTFDSVETADWESTEYEIRVSSDDDEVVGTVTIEEVDEVDEDDDGNENGGSDSGRSSGGGSGSEGSDSSGGSDGGTDSTNSGDDDDTEESNDHEANDEQQSNENDGDDPDEPTGDRRQDDTVTDDEGSQETHGLETDEESGDGLNVDTTEDQTGFGLISGVSAIVGGRYAAKRLAERSDSEGES